MKYDSRRGGHAPSGMREEFEEAIADGLAPKAWGKLWNCTDTMPSSLCEDLGVKLGSSYAVGVRSLPRK